MREARSVFGPFARGLSSVFAFAIALLLTMAPSSAQVAGGDGPRGAGASAVVGGATQSALPRRSPAPPETITPWGDYGAAGVTARRAAPSDLEGRSGAAPDRAREETWGVGVWVAVLGLIAAAVSFAMGVIDRDPARGATVARVAVRDDDPAPAAPTASPPAAAAARRCEATRSPARSPAPVAAIDVLALHDELSPRSRRVAALSYGARGLAPPLAARGASVRAATAGAAPRFSAYGAARRRARSLRRAETAEASKPPRSVDERAAELADRLRRFSQTPAGRRERLSPRA